MITPYFLNDAIIYSTIQQKQDYYFSNFNSFFIKLTKNKIC